MASEPETTGDTRVNPFKEDPAAPAEETPKPKRKPRNVLRPTAPPAEPLPPRPRAARKKNMSDGFALAWGGLGTAIAAKADPPVGMVMQIQAPHAGKQLNKVVTANETLYRWLSPIFGRAETVGDLTSVILPPLLVGAIERRPELYPTLMPMLRSMLRPALRDLAADMKKEREALKALTGEEAAEVEAELDSILSTIFGAGADVASSPVDEGPYPDEPTMTVDGPVPSEVL